MTRIARATARTTGGHDIKIDGCLVNIHLAKIIYKCEQCYSGLERYEAGLRCAINQDHRGFIHRDKVKKIQQQQAQNVDALIEIYEIIDGKVVIK
jgi:hypothetical protein